MTTTTRVFNFSPGPAVLPLPVLEEAQRDLVALPGVGMSVLEISHRGKVFEGLGPLFPTLRGPVGGARLHPLHRLFPSPVATPSPPS